uniref:NTR domain-containing protein n=1 Tax=Steinernema glaseri TaxID=37863 RepID=A0A1I8A6E0_9BILA
MNLFPTSVLLFCLLVDLAPSFEACKCRVQVPNVSYCQAHWVSHARILIRQTKQKLPDGSPRKGLNNIKYSVKHVDTYKVPKELNGTLPTSVFTPSEAPACGLFLDAGKEYLLAGRFEDGILMTVLCGQILYDNPKQSEFENVLEWEQVPDTLRNRLKAGIFDRQPESSTVSVSRSHLSSDA